MQNQQKHPNIMKNTPTKAAILLLAVSLLSLPSPAFAASSGRISGSRFSSGSRSYSRSYSRNTSSGYSSPSRIQSLPRSQTNIVAPPIIRRSDYTRIPRVQPNIIRRRDYMYTPRTQTNIVVVPDLTPQVAPLYPYSPVAPVAINQGPVNPAPFLILIGVLGVGVIASILLSGGWEDFVAPWLSRQSEKHRKVTIVRQRVALLASAKEIQNDMIKMAERCDTESAEGLSKILRETTLALLRHPDKTIYAWSDSNKVSSSSAETTFNRLSVEERSKASEEALSNVDGVVSRGGTNSSESLGENEYIVVSILVVADEAINVKPSNSQDNLHSNLVDLGSITTDNLIALEVIWQPEDEHGVLTKEELLTLYPDFNIL